MITLFFSFLILLIIYVFVGGGLLVLVVGAIIIAIIASAVKRNNSNISPSTSAIEEMDSSEDKDMSKRFDITAVKTIDNYLKKAGIVDIKNESNPVLERDHGKHFTTEEHFRGLIYSLLTNQRKWSDVEPKLPEIDKLFFNYDLDKVKEHNGEYFEAGIRRLKCGNISIKMQMAGLRDDIAVFEQIIIKYGSIDNFVTSMPAEEVVKAISSSGSKYKLQGVGPALAWEYLRNVGIDASKPDTHLKRFFGSERMGISNNIEATDDEVISAVSSIAEEGSYSKFEIDYLIWAYCASGKGEVCTASPNCSKCVIRSYCRK